MPERPVRIFVVVSRSMWSTSRRRVGLDIERAMSDMEEATSIQAVITMASSSGVQEMNILPLSRRMTTSISSMATAQMWSSFESRDVKKPSSRNSSTRRSTIRSAMLLLPSSKQISRELLFCGLGRRTPLALGVKRATSAGGATTVVMRVIMMPMPNISWVR